MFPFSFFFVFLSPDGAVAGVQVLCGDGADDGAGRRVLVHVHEVGGLVEDGRLVHVQHVDLHRGRVLERPVALETRVRVGVGGVHLEGVCLLRLVVQGLKKVKGERGGRERERESGRVGERRRRVRAIEGERERGRQREDGKRERGRERGRRVRERKGEKGNTVRIIILPF